MHNSVRGPGARPCAPSTRFAMIRGCSITSPSAPPIVLRRSASTRLSFARSRSSRRTAASTSPSGTTSRSRRRRTRAPLPAGCTSASPHRRASMSTGSGRRESPRATKATASPVCDPSTATTTTAPSCSIRTATASRQCTMGRSGTAATSTTSGSESPTSRRRRSSTKGSGRRGVPGRNRARRQDAVRLRQRLVLGRRGAGAVGERPPRVRRDGQRDGRPLPPRGHGRRDRYNGAPGERAVYHEGYYAAFVLDPDGNNVEVVNHNR